MPDDCEAGVKARARRGKKSKVNKDPRVIKMCYLEVQDT